MTRVYGCPFKKLHKVTKSYKNYLTKFVIPEQYFYTQQGKICEKIRYKECEDGKGIVPDVDFRGMKRRIRNRKNQVRSVFAEDVPGS